MKKHKIVAFNYFGDEPFCAFYPAYDEIPEGMEVFPYLWQMTGHDRVYEGFVVCKNREVFDKLIANWKKDPRGMYKYEYCAPEAYLKKA